MINCTAILWITDVFLIALQGKFIRINFDSSGYISGANIETCILFTTAVLRDVYLHNV